MARPLRIQYSGAVYHVTSRGNEKKPVFKDDQDREYFLNTLQHVNKRYNWICHAYCLMTNHYHLLIETPEGNLSLGMRQLNGEIPRSQRHSTRSSLKALLPESIMANHGKLMRKLTEAVEKYGYHQSELARHVAVHYSTISRWLREYEDATKKT